jgi:hypothetical protein
MTYTGFGFSSVPAPPKRKVFVSYHHGGDQAYYNAFSASFQSSYDMITDRSLERARDSNDPEYIMRYIRENHISGSSTIIVLCGLNTPYRKYVDWELYAALAQQTSVVGVKLPTLTIVDDGCSKPPRLQDNIDSGYAVWTWWESVYGNPQELSRVIEDANSRRKSLINNTRPRMYRNG